MDVFSLIVTVVVVTASGALAPGPLFFTAVAHGTRSGARGGLAFSVGHSIIEFSLVLLLALGLLSFATEPTVKIVIGVVGGIALLVFGVFQIRETLASRAAKFNKGGASSRNPLLLGLVFTGLNPYFILWWLFIGVKLILDSLAFASLAGVVLMYFAHVWMDYAWLTAVAYLAKKGTDIVGSKGYRILMIAFALILIYFGLYYLASAFL